MRVLFKSWLVHVQNRTGNSAGNTGMSFRLWWWFVWIFIHRCMSALILSTCVCNSKSRSWRPRCITLFSRRRWSSTEILWMSCRRTSYARPWRNCADRCWGRAENTTVRSYRRGWSFYIRHTRSSLFLYSFNICFYQSNCLVKREHLTNECRSFLLERMNMKSHVWVRFIVHSATCTVQTYRRLNWPYSQTHVS